LINRLLAANAFAGKQDTATDRVATENIRFIAKGVDELSKDSIF
jgi:S-adenosylmethionine synthetase